MENKKIVILGHARHGKDTVAELIKRFTGYKFKSSSVAASEIFIFDKLKDKYNYSSVEECFEDRVNHREEWHNLICQYNKDDKSRLAKNIMKNNDIYVGMRSNEELEKSLKDGIFDLVVAVFDPSKPLESKVSYNIDEFSKADFVICNNGTLEQLKEKVKIFCKILQ